MDRTDLRAAFTAAARITRGAGRLALTYFERVRDLAVEEKGPQDFVTDADRDVESFLLERLHLVLPGAKVLAEESATTYESSPDPVWLVDPIDGTGNFVRQLPLFCTSVALWQDGVVRFGLVYDPVRDEMFEALEGEGAFVNGHALACATNADPARAVVAVGRSLKVPQEPVKEAIGRALEAGFAVRMLGSAVLASAWVAAGRLDAFYEARLSPWDVGAAMCIATEAGCICEPRLGARELREGTPFLVSSPALVDAVRYACGLAG